MKGQRERTVMLTAAPESIRLLRRLFTLTFDDLHFLELLRAPSQRLYRALVLVWARVERVLVSDPSEIPEEVIKQVSKQLSLPPLCFRGGATTLRRDRRPLTPCASICGFVPGKSQMPQRR